MPELLLSLNLLTSWTLHILYSISHWQLRILVPPLDFSAPKKIVTGGGDCPPAPPEPPRHYRGNIKHAVPVGWYYNAIRDPGNCDFKKLRSRIQY